MDFIETQFTQRIESLEQQITTLTKEYDSIKQEFDRWIVFKSIGLVHIPDPALNKNYPAAVASSLNKVKRAKGAKNGTWIDKIKVILKARGSELFTDEISELIKPNFQGKTVEWINVRVSSTLSEKGERFGLYGRANDTDVPKHHKAKLWGVVEFKNEHGNVMPKHKYKSTL